MDFQINVSPVYPNPDSKSCLETRASQAGWLHDTLFEGCPKGVFFFNREHCVIFCNTPINFSRSLDETYHVVQNPTMGSQAIFDIRRPILLTREKQEKKVTFSGFVFLDLIAL